MFRCVMEHWSLDNQSKSSDNKSKSSDNVFIVPYWLVRGTTDESLVNMKMKLEKISEKMFGTEITIMVPTLINVKEIKAGDELFTLQVHDDSAENQSEKQPVDATSSKRASTSSSSGSKRAKK